MQAHFQRGQIHGKIYAQRGALLFLRAVPDRHARLTGTRSLKGSSRHHLVEGARGFLTRHAATQPRTSPCCCFPARQPAMTVPAGAQVMVSSPLPAALNIHPPAAARPPPPPAAALHLPSLFHPPQPLFFKVECGTKQGLFSMSSEQVLCTCEECAATAAAAAAGGSSRDPRSGDGGLWMSLHAFEKHGGKATYKKPKASIRIKATRAWGKLGAAAAPA